MLRDLVLKFIDIFKAPSEIFSVTSKVQHRIILEDHKPITLRPYRLPFCEREIMRKQIDDLLDDGIIQHSESPYSTPAILVTKKQLEGQKEPEYRLCIEYRKTNRVTNLAFLDSLSGSQSFPTLDLYSGYHQI